MKEIGPGAAINLHADAIEEYLESLRARDFPLGVAEQNPGLAEQPWGRLDMLLVDAFGYRLIFTNVPGPVSRGSLLYSE